ncbi:DNA primase [Celerinatantimonas yamalensis]|uniref:DNA primase n=1 Tax=Celerinatantimonas yamalensis TaxID=559956 RepID=A0ABW9G4R7_9GAMM
MAGRISQQFIDDLLARVDIVSLIDQRVRLKKAGKNYQACCPFHNEKSPSFTVSPDKQFYHCFGCGAHGNAIGFLMEYERFEFVEAVEDLAAIAGVEVQREETGQGGHQSAPPIAQSRDLYELMTQVNRFYQYQLRKNTRSNVVIDYLKGRGLSGEVVKDFGIGYAPDEWDALSRQFGQTTEQIEQLLRCGMLIENDNKRRYDRFRDRLMFPIRDRRGRYIGFGGRVLGDGTPKYLNSPETDLFHKGRELYGLYEVRQKHKRIDQILVVEGYMDVVSLAQFGIDYAVASLGTSTTSDQLQLLFRASNRIICCYDGDRAGRDAAWRALENALPQLRDGVELQFMFLPDGEDPDTLVRKIGKAEFESQLHQAQPLSEFMFQKLGKEIDTRTDAGKSHLADQARTLIGQVQAGFYQDMLKSSLAHWLRWDERRLERFFTTPKQPQRSTTANKMKLTPMRRAVAIVLQHPQTALDAPDLSFLHALPLKGSNMLIELVQQIRDKPDITTAQLLERWRERPEVAALSKMASLNLEGDELIDIDGYTQELNDILASFVEQLLQQRYDELLQKSLNQMLSRKEKQEMLELQQELRAN